MSQLLIPSNLSSAPTADTNGQSKFKVISTFSGCGGSSLGYQLAGGKVLLAVEFDKNAVETYRANFKDTPIWFGDIAELSVDKCLDITGIRPGELDIFDGSPPCQGFSTAGKRDLNDNRNQLFNEYVRLLRGLKPKCFVMENVSGMVKGKMKLIFVEILKELRKSGYNVRARLLNAKYFNVPQSRERMIFIGVKGDLELDPVFPMPLGLPITLRTALKDVPYEDVPEITWRKHLVHLVKTGKRMSDYEKGAGFQSCFRPYWNKPCPTLTKIIAGIGYGSLLHPEEDRVLSIPEMRRISSFPDDFKFIGKYVEARARIGNSVPPNFMRAIAESIYENILKKC